MPDSATTSAVAEEFRGDPRTAPPSSGMDPMLLEPELAALVTSLRAEAAALKECFTRYSFQAIAVSVGILGLVARFLWETPAVGLAAIAAAFIVLMTRRLGTYKYAAANRLNGYELHLFRTRDIPAECAGHRWEKRMRGIGWEEAMRAWRVVQATLFVEIYFSHRFLPNVQRWRYKASKGPFWWSQSSMLKAWPGVVWHPGSYLRTIMLLLAILAFAVVGCLVAMTVVVHVRGFGDPWFTAAMHMALFMLGVVVLRLAMDWKRRQMIEDGLLSIHSSAILWQAVVIAHYSALERARATNLTLMDMRAPLVFGNTILGGTHVVPDGSGYRGYTFWLAKEAASLARHADDIHGWIAGVYLGEDVPTDAAA